MYSLMNLINAKPCNLNEKDALFLMPNSLYFLLLLFLLILLLTFHTIVLSPNKFN